ncbi:hypothetical protein MPSEU_000326900 [Mayamaea pseudoterrestris]|nr:hypothetical protein MPSEU_000326900 [Mayamaea pseudoterrestris]
MATNSTLTDVPIPLIPRIEYDTLPKVTLNVTDSQGRNRKREARECNSPEVELLIKTITHHEALVDSLDMKDKATEQLQTFREMLNEELRDSFDNVIVEHEINVTSVAAIKLAQRMWLALFIPVNTGYEREKEYILTVKKPFGKDTTWLYMRLMIISKLLGWFPREPPVEDRQNKSVFTTDEIRFMLYKKQPEAFQKKLSDAGKVYTEMTTSQLCEYFNRLRVEEAKEQGKKRPSTTATTATKEATRNNNGFRGGGRGGRGRGRLGGRGGRGNNNWCNRDHGPGVQAHLWKDCDDNPFKRKSSVGQPQQQPQQQQKKSCWTPRGGGNIVKTKT